MRGMFLSTIRPVLLAAIGIVAAAIIGAASAQAADWYVSPTGVDPGGCATAPNDGVGPNDPPYLTIKKAIACATAGDIIHVAAGNYAEVTLVLNKSLTLLGPQSGVSACARVASEAVVTPATASDPALQIDGSTNPSGIVIDGFTFSGSTNFACVRLENGTAPSMQFLNNRVRSFTGIGVFWNRSVVNGIFSGNEVDGSSITGSSGNVLLDGADAFHGFRFNNNCIINNPNNTGLFCDGNHNWTANAPATQPPTINGNKFQSCGTAINLGSRSFNTATAATASISNNQFISNTFDGLQGGIQKTSIASNLFQNNGRSGIALTSFGNTGADRGGQQSTITGNTFTGNVSEGLLLSASQAVGTISTNQAHNNDFLGTTVGVRYGGTETINLTCNWWNHINGPNHTSNPNPSGSQIIGTNMTFSPWLNGSITGSPLCNQTPDRVQAITAGLCISGAHPCVNVPFTFTRVDATPARGISVTFTINTAKLQLCGTVAASIHQGTWLSGFANTSFQVIDNGGGSYTVDQAILGLPCGVTTGGQLFTVDLTNSDGDGTGVITVTAVTVRDCNNAPIPGGPGSPANIPVQITSPAPITDLAASQVVSGNGAVSTTGIRLTWATGGAGTVSIYRAPFGSYPEYDDDGPVTPPNPAVAPAAPWVLVTASATSPYVDAAAARGFWYYVAFVKDACDNVSTVSNMTAGNLNYLLGDVTPAPGSGDNKVDGLDISLLGFNYGLTGEVPVDAVGYLDVGPTLTGAANARPTPDDKLNFEDLIIYAINYGPTGYQVPNFSAQRVGGGRNELTLDAPKQVLAGSEFTVSLRLKGAGDLQGLSAQLGWDGAVAEPIAVSAGEMLSSQNGVAFSSAPGDVDVALLGARGDGLGGNGVLATVTFRARSTGNPGVSIATVDARDAANRKVDLTGAQQHVLPTTTAFAPPAPNPFSRSATLAFSLAQSGAVELAIYSVEGRRVRTLVRGPLDPGEFRFTWDGTDDGGHAVHAGLYFARLVTPVGRFTRRMMMIQ